MVAVSGVHTVLCVLPWLPGRVALRTSLSHALAQDVFSQRLHQPKCQCAMLAKGFGSGTVRDNQPERRRLPLPYQPCPCHSGEAYDACCKPFHDGDRDPRPEELMRARYAAYASGMPRYIMESTHPDHDDFRKPGWAAELAEFCEKYRFTGLEVGAPSFKPDAPNAAHVYFTATGGTLSAIEMEGHARLPCQVPLKGEAKDVEAREQTEDSSIIAGFAQITLSAGHDLVGKDGGGAVSFDERSLFVTDDDGKWLYRAADKDYEISVAPVGKRSDKRKAFKGGKRGGKQPDIKR